MGRDRAGRRWIRGELPLPAPLPRIANAELGLRNLSTRLDGGHEMLVTLLDTPDHRLMRSGAVLAHRVCDGAGDWYLAVPSWVEPNSADAAADRSGHGERVAALVEDGDLPPDFQAIVTPFRRLATLGPVAALSVERQVYLVRDGDATVVGTLRDEKVTIRRGGLTTARYREVTLAPHRKRMTPEQRDWLAEALTGAGATLVDRFPDLPHRLGAPASGPTDLPDPADLSDETLAGWVARDLATGLRALVVRRDQAAAHWLARRLTALTPALDEAWAQELRAELMWVADAGEDADLERYLALLEVLVRGTRVPRTRRGDDVGAVDVIAGLRADAIAIVRQRCGSVAVGDEDAQWVAALDSVVRAVEVAELDPQRRRKQRRRLTKLADQLQHCVDPEVEALRARADAVPSEAFDLGREYEQRHTRLVRRRRALVDGWAEIAAGLGK